MVHVFFIMEQNTAVAALNDWGWGIRARPRTLDRSRSSTWITWTRNSMAESSQLLPCSTCMVHVHRAMSGFGRNPGHQLWSPNAHHSSRLSHGTPTPLHSTPCTCRIAPIMRAIALYPGFSVFSRRRFPLSLAACEWHASENCFDVPKRDNPTSNQKAEGGEGLLAGARPRHPFTRPLAGQGQPEPPPVSPSMLARHPNRQWLAVACYHPLITDILYISAAVKPGTAIDRAIGFSAPASSARRGRRWRSAKLPWRPQRSSPFSPWLRSCARRPPRGWSAWSTRPRTTAPSACSSSATGAARARTTSPGSPIR